MFPAVAFPFCAVFALVGEVNREASILHTEIQMEVLPAGLDAHPPGIVGHLLQVDESALGDNLIKRRSPIWQMALGSDLE